VSPNWAGYTATAPAGKRISFTRIAGTWRQPLVSCAKGDAGAASAVWVGLGGYSGSLREVEQVGANSNCGADGKPTYYAWFELVPYPAYTIAEPVGPGDTIAASVEIVPGAARLSVENRTRHWTFTRQISWATPDTSSAEWIVEAPAACKRYACAQPHLANFGSVRITQISVTGNARTGTLAEPAWQVTPIRLVPATQHFTLSAGGPGDESGKSAQRRVRTASAGAIPGAISADGSAFTISRVAAPTE
jgi:hypothetical protein